VALTRAPFPCFLHPGFGYDDIELFARLRSLTIIKNLNLGAKTKGYLEYMSAKFDVPLYDQMAV